MSLKWRKKIRDNRGRKTKSSLAKERRQEFLETLMMWRISLRMIRLRWFPKTICQSSKRKANKRTKKPMVKPAMKTACLVATQAWTLTKLLKLELWPRKCWGRSSVSKQFLTVIAEWHGKTTNPCFHNGSLKMKQRQMFQISTWPKRKSTKKRDCSRSGTLDQARKSQKPKIERRWGCKGPWTRSKIRHRSLPPKT